MPRLRPVWTRGLRLYHMPPALDDVLDNDGEDLPGVHARSRFRHLDDPERFAEYSIREVPPLGLETDRWIPGSGEDHTLIVVREFRRVPLDASGLGLLVFSTRPGRAAQAIATLAHWVERAVSLYQPTYLLLAHSLEQPRVVALLAGVRERRALQWASATPFSVEMVLPDLMPFLDQAPEPYLYLPEPVAATVTSDVSPYAV